MIDNIPLVTVIVPCYNHEKDVERCLKSIFAQTFKNFELIVIDDCSQDNSIRVIESLLVVYQFKFIKNQKNQGLIANLNQIVFNEARGKYIKIIAADDFLIDDGLNVLVKSFEKQDENCAFVYGQVQYFKTINHEVQFLPHISGKETNYQELLFEKNVIPAPATLISKQKFLDIGGIKSLYIEDYYLWLKLLEKYDCFFINSVVSYYQISSNKQSMSKQTIKMFLGHINLFSGLLFDNKESDFQQIQKFYKRIHFMYLDFLQAYIYQELTKCKKNALKCYLRNFFRFIKYFQIKFLIIFWVDFFRE